MWAHLLLESSIQQNFNFGFATHKSDVLLYLSQWQYWWWFWFSLLWVLYYYIIIFNITKRNFLFNPTINTSLRSHGKWGDFLIALIPLSWCGNILINSNFILRLIEWQNEGSLLTLRVQGKQWYWVYKFDGTSATSILGAPKNIGHNKWLIWFMNDIFIADSYYQAIHLASQLEFKETHNFWLSIDNLLKKNLEPESLISDNTRNTFLQNNTNLVDIIFDFFVFDFDIDFIDFNFLPITADFLALKNYQLNYYDFFMLFFDIDYIINYFSIKKKNIIGHYEYKSLEERSNTAGNLYSETNSLPLEIYQSPLNLYQLEMCAKQDKLYLLFKLIFTDTADTIVTKPEHSEPMVGYYQKKYKRLTKFKFIRPKQYDPITFLPISKSKSNILEETAIEKLTSVSFVQESPDKDPSKRLELTIINNAPEDIIEKDLGIEDWMNQFKACIKPEKIDLFKEYPYQTYSNIQLFFNKDKTMFNAKETNMQLDEELKIEKENINVTGIYDFYNAVRVGKQRADLLSITLARRLLRVKRTIVLPAHVNITVITNSYDVVHSWFIPGLGLKLDCVPGRSTHHTLYIDTIGFYYGQCAEICGRYHHHMPIRICALSYDQFLVWWLKKGIPHLERLKKQGTEKEGRYYNLLKSEEYLKSKENYVEYKYKW